MKKLLVSWLLVSWLFGYEPITVFGQELCSDDNQCTEDIYYLDGTTDECIHKHGGFCNLDTNECAYAYDPEEDESKCATPEPTEEPPPAPSTPSQPIIPTTPPPEEQAVYSQSQGLLPGFKNSITCNLNPIQQFFSAILSIFNVNFCDPQNFYNESKFLHQSELPKKLSPTGSTEDQIKGFLGGPTSSYGVTLPTFKNQTGTVAETEKRYEKSHFPKDITPITGK